MTGQFYWWGERDMINPVDMELIYNNSPTNAQFCLFTQLFYIENNDKPYYIVNPEGSSSRSLNVN